MIKPRYKLFLTQGCTQEEVDEMMGLDNIKIEVKENGKWVETTHDAVIKSPTDLQS